MRRNLVSRRHFQSHHINSRLTWIASDDCKFRTLFKDWRRIAPFDLRGGRQHVRGSVCTWLASIPTNATMVAQQKSKVFM